MQISPAQWDNAANRYFTDRIAALIRTEHPDQSRGIKNQAFAHLVRTLLPQAHRYGLYDERSSAVFVYAGWILGEHFDIRIPVLAQVLADSALTPIIKAEAILDFTASLRAVLETRDPSRKLP